MDKSTFVKHSSELSLIDGSLDSADSVGCFYG